MRRPIRELLALLPALLVGCAEPPPPATAPPSPPQPQVVRIAPTPAEPRLERGFCEVLSGLIEAERDGFAGLRGRSLGVERWTGERTVPGTERCTIEGEAWPRARYACVGAPVEADQRDRLAAEFALLREQIDACLDKPVWYPRRWEEGEPFLFAMGERQQVWTDHSTLPPSAVILRLQRGVEGHDYRLRLDLATIR